jgi:hypothetical protein
LVPLSTIASYNNILIIELLLSEKWNEGLALKNFLEMSDFDNVKVCYKSCKKPNQFMDFLKKTSIKYDIIHISAHGNIEDEEIDDPHIQLSHPAWKIYGYDFDEGIFKDKLVCLSVCLVGNKSFVEPFIFLTDAKYVIGTSKEVDPKDTRKWFEEFYDQLINDEKSIVTAFNSTNKRVRMISPYTGRRIIMSLYNRDKMRFDNWRIDAIIEAWEEEDIGCDRSNIKEYKSVVRAW